MLFCYFFFFQAEDGIRDYKVTGVQTCALPICAAFWSGAWIATTAGCRTRGPLRGARSGTAVPCSRSGERRVGEEGRSRGAPDHLKKKKKKKRATVSAQQGNRNEPRRA